VLGAWAVRLPADAAAHAAGLRLVDGVRWCVDGSAIWLAGDRADAGLLRVLAALPGAERFLVDGHGRCRALGCHLPTARLPEGPWLPLRDRVVPALPTPALPAAVPVRCPLRVVRGGLPATANVLWTSLVALQAWVGTAPVVWLRTLRFAAARGDRALLHGPALPPLPGPVAVEQDGVAVPAGHRLEPDCPRPLVAAVLRLQPLDLASFAVDGGCTIIRADAFVVLSRSAVRKTLAQVARG
jgi:hypothetical protein